MDIKRVFIFTALCTALVTGKSIRAFNNDISQVQDKSPEIDMTTVEIIAYFGYPAETHTITTKDGYILQLHRIPHGIKPTSGPRPPVMVQHGLFSSSADFVINFPHQSLGFMLADAGYDVWLTNARGNKYGRAHTSLDPDKDEEFWHFTWDQMGEFDTPGHIDYILNYTKYDQLYYIGHSMGTTMAFAMMASKPEYNAKIKLMMGLGPAAFASHIRSPLKLLTPFVKEIKFLLQFLGIGELLPADSFIKFLAPECNNVLERLCEDIMYIVMGYDPKELNKTRLDVYTSHAPAGSSSWTLIHYIQLVNSAKFQHCDWGLTENLRRYRQPTPPEYDLSAITAPVALFWGANDLMADPQDVAILSAALPNLIGSYQVGDKFWSHYDFIWAIHAASLLNEKLINMMPRY